MEGAAGVAGGDDTVDEVCGAGTWAEMAPEASICKTARCGLEIAPEFSNGASTDETGSAVPRGALTLGAKTDEGPGGLASKRWEREPENKSALEAKVHKETLMLMRDALAEAKRCVQLVGLAFAAGRVFGAGVCTMKSPLGFEGTVWLFEVTCEKTAPELQKRRSLESRS